jgi:hypothetical protein
MKQLFLGILIGFAIAFAIYQFFVKDTSSVKRTGKTAQQNPYRNIIIKGDTIPFATLAGAQGFVSDIKNFDSLDQYFIQTNQYFLDKTKNKIGGYFELDKDNNFVYAQARPDPDPTDPIDLDEDARKFQSEHPGFTFAVNLTNRDVINYSNIVSEAARADGRTIDSFRIKFIKYTNAPRIRGTVRNDYKNKVSVALVAMSAGSEYVECVANSLLDIRPRNLGTICPVCRE